MVRLPGRYAPFAFSIIQVTLTTGVATAIGVHQSTAFGMQFLMQWIIAWGVAWASMVPIVIFAAPLIQRFVAAVTAPPGGQGQRR